MGLRPIYGNDETSLLAAIRQIKAQGPLTRARQTLRSASDELQARGARVQLIACTEFSLVADSAGQAAQVFDTLDVLAGAIKAYAIGDQDRQESASR